MQFKAALHALCDAHVEFVVIGGLAATLHGIWDEATLRNSTVLTLQTDLGEIDLPGEVAGIGDWDRVNAHSITVDIFDRGIAALDLRALIASKRVTGREKDLAALPELESLLEAGES